MPAPAIVAAIARTAGPMLARAVGTRAVGAAAVRGAATRGAARIATTRVGGTAARTAARPPGITDAGVSMSRRAAGQRAQQQAAHHVARNAARPRVQDISYQVANTPANFRRPGAPPDPQAPYIRQQQRIPGGGGLEPPGTEGAAPAPGDDASSGREERDAERGERHLQRIGSLLAKMAGAVGVIAGTVKGIQATGSALLSRQRELAPYNSQIAATLSRLQIERTRRDIRTGAATAASTERLGQAQNQLEEALLPFRILTTNVTNNVVSAIAKATSVLTTALVAIPGPIGAAIVKAQRDEQAIGKTGYEEFLKSLDRAGKAARPRGKSK